MPAKNVRIINIIVRGKTISWGSVNVDNSSVLTIDCVIGRLNTCSGAVSAPRKGKTEPILIISDNDDNIINIKI